MWNMLAHIFSFKNPQADTSWQISFERDKCNQHKSSENETARKPHACDQCEKRFTELSSLKEHKKIHLGQNSFVLSN